MKADKSAFSHFISKKLSFFAKKGEKSAIFGWGWAFAELGGAKLVAGLFLVKLVG